MNQNKKSCPLCGLENAIKITDDLHHHITCENCSVLDDHDTLKSFRLSIDMAKDLIVLEEDSNDIKDYKIQLKQDIREKILLSSQSENFIHFDSLRTPSFPSIQKMMKLVMLWLEIKTYPGKTKEVSYKNLGSLMGARNIRNYNFILLSLIDLKYILASPELNLENLDVKTPMVIALAPKAYIFLEDYRLDNNTLLSYN